VEFLLRPPRVRVLGGLISRSPTPQTIRWEKFEEYLEVGALCGFVMKEFWRVESFARVLSIRFGAGSVPGYDVSIMELIINHSSRERVQESGRFELN